MIKNMVPGLADLGVQMPALPLTSWLTLGDRFTCPSAVFPAIRWNDNIHLEGLL